MITSHSLGSRGGGIAGLTLAIALTQKIKHDRLQIRIDLYESAKQFSEIGAGVSMMRRPWHIMESIGLGDRLRQLCHVPNIDDHGEYHRLLNINAHKGDCASSQGFRIQEKRSARGFTFH